MAKKAIVIGSGIAGIASSIRLSMKGYEVTVYEKNTYPGGKLSEIHVDGFRFDAGPSLFTMPQYVDELFVLAGKTPREYFEYARLNEVCRYFWNDGMKFTASGNNKSFAKRASEKFDVSEKQVLDKLNKAAFIEETTGKLFLEQSLHKPSGFLNKQTMRAIFRIPKLGLNKTLHEVNKESFVDNRFVQLFDRYATYNGSDPFQTPGIMEVIPHYEYNIGAFFPNKGMVDITNSLVRLAKDCGVEFVFNTTVDEILVQGNKVTGVMLGSGKTDKAELIVSNMDVYFTYTKLLKRLKTPKKRISQERSSSALIFYWGINGSFEELDVHNVFFADDYKAEFEAIFKHKVVYSDPTVYIHISSKVKKDDAPEGMENWFVMINTPPKGEINWESYIDEARKNILQKLSKVLARNIEELVVEEDKLFPSTIESKTMSFEGSLYGTSSNSKYAAFLRQPNFHKKLKGLHFVGGSVHPGGGIPLCLLSAKIATDHVPST